MRRFFSMMLLIAATAVLMCGCVKPLEEDKQQQTQMPAPEYIIGEKVEDTIMNWNDPAIFYCYNMEMNEEYLVITDMPIPQDDESTRIAIIETAYRGLDGLKDALNSSFCGTVVAYQEISTPDAMYLHNAALTGTGMEQEYQPEERINLSDYKESTTGRQYYLGYVFHDENPGRSHEIWNKLNSGSSIVLIGNMATTESHILKRSRAVYERVLEQNGIDFITMFSDIVA